MKANPRQLEGQTSKKAGVIVEAMVKIAAGS
jgi:hypothetical protein